MPYRGDAKVAVYAPYARDSTSLVSVLSGQGIPAGAVGSVAGLASELNDQLGAAVITEEALDHADWAAVVRAVKAQPSWSAYPFIFLVSQRKTFGRSEGAFAIVPADITNAIVLERPMGSATLVSAVRWALAGRRRQFVTRDHLEQLERNAAHQRLMTRELAHRVKNTIAVLQSIVTQTMRPHPELESIKTIITGRFAALARAHDLLLGVDFQAADFRDLVERQLSVHQGDFRAEGPSIRLSPQASLSFALVLHELATNSIKYGSLKAEQGRVDISWAVSKDAAPMFDFRWCESGGEPIVAPVTAGFGTRLIKSTLSGLGTVAFNYPRQGFELVFNGPLRELTHAVVPSFE